MMLKASTKKIWEDSKARRQRAQEEFDRAVESVDDAHYHHEQWESQQRVCNALGRLEAAKQSESIAEAEVRKELGV